MCGRHRDGYHDDYKSRRAALYADSGRIKHLWKTYRLTAQQFDELWDRQGGRCAICSAILSIGTQNGTHVDHDHDTGRIRGLLCPSCNRGLGQFKDDVDILKAAVSYLEKGGDLEDA